LSGQNKYLTARLLTGMTREETAPLLYISEKTLQRIETGEQPCSPDKAILMAKVYGFPWVADPNIPDNYRPKPVANALLQYMKEHADVDKVLPRLTAILADGKVDDNEAEEYRNCAREIEEAIAAGKELEYAY
jgi:DNA-binding XRE family transcriptional regulator